MKDYSLNKRDRNSFILGYKVVNNMIIVLYADGSICGSVYSYEYEKKILELMKEQVINSNEFSFRLDNKYKICFKLLIYEIILFISLIISSIISFPSIIAFILGISICFSLSVFTLYKLNSYKKIKDDIRKNLLFISNNSLNNIIRENECIRERLNDTYRFKCIDTSRRDFFFTLNTINNIKYKDLVILYEQAMGSQDTKTLCKRRYKR